MASLHKKQPLMSSRLEVLRPLPHRHETTATTDTLSANAFNHRRLCNSKRLWLDHPKNRNVPLNTVHQGLNSDRSYREKMHFLRKCIRCFIKFLAYCFRQICNVIIRATCRIKVFIIKLCS